MALTRVLAGLMVLTLALPVASGLGLVLLPAFGIDPALGLTMPGLQAFAALAGRPGVARSAVLSLIAGLGSTAIALLLACSFLAVLQSGRSRLARMLARLISPLLAVPHATIGFALAFLIAPSGLIARWISPWATGWSAPPTVQILNDPWGLGLMAALVIKETPFLLLVALASLPQIRPDQRLMLARSLGYRPITGWLLTIAPGLYPLIRLPVYAVIAYASAPVDLALILGPVNPPLLAVSILRLANDPDLSLRPVAAAAALLQLLVTGLCLLLWRLLEVAAGRLLRHLSATGRRGRGEALLAGLGLCGSTLIALAVALGLSGLVLASIGGLWRFPADMPASLTLMIWQRSLPGLWPVLWDTAWVALTAALLALILVLAALETESRSGRSPGRLALLILYLPLLIPQIAFLFGLAIAAELAGWRPSAPLVLATHLIFVLPYVYLSLSGPWRQRDPRQDQVAQSLGCSPARILWRIKLPVLLGPILAALAIGMAVSIGQYLPTLLMGAGRITTITTEAVALSSGNDRRVIGVHALLQTLLPALGFWVAAMLPRLIWRHRRALHPATAGGPT